MRIIAGEHRGKRLRTLEGDAVRPTSDMVKEALFNILQFQLEGRAFLDLFAGCGQIGIEALSRGAKSAVFTDASKSAVGVTEQNLKSAGLAERARVIAGDALVFMANTQERFDVAFLDPPYGADLLERALLLTAERMNSGGVIVCEHPKEQEPPEWAGKFQRVKTYRYGKIMLTAYRQPAAEDEEGDVDL